MFTVMIARNENGSASFTAFADSSPQVNRTDKTFGPFIDEAPMNLARQHAIAFVQGMRQMDSSARIYCYTDGVAVGEDFIDYNRAPWRGMKPIGR